ncbi:MAG: enoyl-CoA hydratase/isomerase family protein [Novosphingobium sp.]|nr:enoyl-CoA hydratase/isomerase family protein [Novosphingobium sp.]MCP5403399.1 enoyl-CoA hydratase/isomerase family protein [Novosphingobium sp.]
MTVHYQERGHVALITIDRPERRGAMNLESYQQLAEGWRTAAAAPTVRAVVITGVGDSYCAGADLKEFIPMVAEGARDRAEKGEKPEAAPASDDAIEGSSSDLTLAVLRGVDYPKPIVAAVNGPCVASGMEMLLGTDLRIASPDAVFGLPEVKRGLFASGGSTVRLPRQIPYVHAMDILLTGRHITAQEAMQFGLINRIVEKAELLDTAMEIAHAIAANSPGAVSATKLSVLDGFKTGITQAYARELEHGDKVFSAPDAIEGPKAFLEKREPRWTGVSQSV